MTQTNFGEIVLGNGRGDLLRDACLMQEVNSIVEIGTLDGTGSTKIILKALETKDPTKVAFLTIEAHAGAHALATSNIGEYAFPVRALHGALIHTDSPLLLVGLSETEKIWLKSDSESRFSQSPFILSEIPEQFDLLVLDGGEFSTFNDYLLLRKRCRYLYLDDVKVRKNRLVLKTALDDGFSIIRLVEDGNGACLLSIRSSSPV